MMLVNKKIIVQFFLRVQRLTNVLLQCIPGASLLYGNAVLQMGICEALGICPAEPSKRIGMTELALQFILRVQRLTDVSQYRSPEFHPSNIGSAIW